MMAAVGAGAPTAADEEHAHVPVASWVQVQQPAAAVAGEAARIRAAYAHVPDPDPVRVRRPWVSRSGSRVAGVVGVPSAGTSCLGLVSGARELGVMSSVETAGTFVAGVEEAEAQQMRKDRDRARPCAPVERESAQASLVGCLRLAEACAVVAVAVAVAAERIR